jgi:hypothetical protein
VTARGVAHVIARCDLATKGNILNMTLRMCVVLLVGT